MTRPDEERPPSAPIELEPLGEGVFGPNQFPDPPESQMSGPRTPSPIPPRPGYHCPRCNYDVRGIAGRVCPECGEIFTLSEALYAGLLHNPNFKADFRVIRRRRFLLWVGIGLALLTVLTWACFKMHPVLMVAFAIPHVLVGYCIFRFFRLEAETGVFITGTLLAVVTAILLLS